MRTTQLALAICLVGLFSAVAAAVPTLRLTDGAVTFEIADNSASDTNPAVGVVSFDGTVGGFDVQSALTIGVSKPATLDPLLSIESFQASSSTSGTLFVLFSDTDFAVPGPGGFLTTFNGLSGINADLGLIEGSFASLSTFAGFAAENVLFSEEFQIGGPLLDNGSAISMSDFTPIGLIADPYALTAVLTIHHEVTPDVIASELPVITEVQGQIIGADVPEPGTLLLLGLGWVVLARARKPC